MNSESKRAQMTSTDERQTLNTTLATEVATGSLRFSALRKATKVITTDDEIDNNREQLTAQTLKERETDRIGTQKYYELRSKWSIYIRNFVWFMLGFQLFLAIAIGAGWLNFTSYQFFINLVIGQNFAQIIGMGVIVAKFLFSKKG
jgi:hypothetical protein